MEEAIKGFNGDIGIYVKNLRTGKTIAINADTVFPTASIVKVPILIGVIDKIEKKELRYDSSHVYRDSLLYAGEDILGSFKDGEKIYLKKLIMLMLTMSDNTASLWLQELAGTGAAVNSILSITPISIGTFTILAVGKTVSAFIAIVFPVLKFCT